MGADSDFTVTQSGANTTFKNVTTDGNVIFNVNDGGKGGVTVFSYTLQKNTEYVFKLGTTVSPPTSLGYGGAGAFFYEKGRLLVGAAVGVGKEGIERAGYLADAGVDAVVIDTAHGHTKSVLDLLKSLKKSFNSVDIVVGNIATAKAAEELINAGADAVKVGIGPGSICTTRVVAGVGVPQLTAVMDVYEVTKKHNIPLLATNNTYYTNKDEANAHDILLCVKEGEKQATPIGRGRGFRYGFPNQEYYFKSQEEMKRLFQDLPDAILNIESLVAKLANAAPKSN